MSLVNFLFVAIIIFMVVFYFYYKTKQFRSTLPIRKKWYQAKAGIVLGVFIAIFGINSVIIYDASVVSLLVALLFLVVGANVAFNNYKRARHEGQFVQEELKLNS